MPIEIRKDLPMPKRNTRLGVPSPYPFAELKVGECFLMPPAANGSSTKYPSGSSMAYWSRKLGRKFVSRKIVENGVTCIGVWRTE